MKKKVTYQIRGQVERSCTFNIGKATVRIDFNGGSISAYGVLPAQYSTENALYQHAIERSDAYRRGEIVKVGELILEEEQADAAPAEPVGQEEQAEPDSNSYSEVTNMQQARNILVGEPYKLPIAELQTKAQVKAAAVRVGVTFPNWN